MLKLIALFPALWATAALATAQCLDVTSPGTAIGTGDDVVFATHYPLGFDFPIQGAAAPTYNHVRVCTNGWLALTDGVNSPGLPTAYSGTTAQMVGVAGDAPRIMCFWRDLNITTGNGASVYIDTTSNPGVSARISWVNAVDYSFTTQKSVQVTLFATGEVQVAYSNGCNVQGAAAAFVGVSPGNGTVVPAMSDLSTTGVTTDVCVYESFPTNQFDLGGSSYYFVPTGAGWTWFRLCTPAFNAPYGTGCYSYSQARESFYQLFADAAAASAQLQGNALQLQLTGNGYLATWLPGVAAALYVTPGATATLLPTTDDGSHAITPSIPLTVPGGTATQLNVSHNGIVSAGAASTQGTDWSPTGPEFAASTGAGFYSWYDFNDGETGSGRIKHEQVGGMLYVTWDAVEAYDVPAVVNPHTFQFQFDLASGTVTIVWVTVNPTVYAGRSYLVGYNDAGASVDPGSIDLTTALPLLTQPDVTLLPLTLAAAPPPVNDGVNGTTITFTVTNVPDFLQSTPGVVYVSTLFLSTGSLPGVDLGLIGASGCPAYIASLDYNVGMGPFTSPTQTGSVFFPPGPILPPGTDVYAQAVALFDTAAGLLPNGQNTFGMVTSNGMQLHVEAQ